MKITNTLFKTMLLSTALLAGQSDAADRFDPEAQPLGYIGSIELSTTDISNGGKAYRGWFENGAWTGDLIEYDVSPQGVLTSSIEQTATGPSQSGTANWSANLKLMDNASTPGYWNTTRKIITSTNGTNQKAFRWSNLTNAQKAMIDQAAFDKDATSSDVLDFLRGDRSNEKPGGNLRLRLSLLSDIIRSNPEYLAAPEGTFSESSYIAYKNANLSRPPRVYVGSNTGKLHAFNASNGNEVWSYIPSMVMHKLARLAGTPYAHTYFVDGGITISDAYFGGAWHSALVGSMGAGAKGLFGLDVTSAAMSSENLASGNNRKILWELHADSDDDLGYIYDQSTIAKLNDGKWYAVQGNGVSSVNGVAKLYLVELGSGTVTKVSTGEGTAGSPNGLSAPALVDTNGDGTVDVAYAGDIDGDMWKFDLTSSSPSSWKVAYKLYNGTSTQPITTAPDITKHPNFGFLVLFGTGRLYTDADIADTSVQAMYGIWDTLTAPSGSETRLAQLLSENTDFNGGGYSETVRTFTTTAAIDYNSVKGWMVALPAGERLVTTPTLRAGRLKAAIMEPMDQDNWLLELTFDEGGVAKNTIFDLDRNGKLQKADRVDGNLDNDLDDLEDIPMAWEGNSGSMSQVTIASLGNGLDTLYQNNLSPQIIRDTCTGDCINGLEGGHMDVDTDAAGDNGIGGRTNGHVHEYDKKYGVTYVDYFDIEASWVLSNVTTVGINESEEFIVLLANADMSPGAILTINDKSYSVVEYQRMVHKALANWNGVGPLEDDDGDSLIHSIQSLKATKVANPDAILLRNSFDNLAIISGGLHPTQASCVKNQNTITKGRWRNGSLTFHLIRKSAFNGLGTDSALDRLVVQTPSDLKEVVVLSDGTQVELTEDVNGDGDADDSASPDYEIYGGLIAKENANFLFESVLFWHFGDLAREHLGVRPCYGDAQWEEAFIIETQGILPEVFADLLEDAGFTDFAELEAFVETLEGCKDIKKKKGGCRETYNQVEDLYNMGLLVENTKEGGDGGGGGGTTGSGTTIEGQITGDDTECEGCAGDKKGEGSNYELGRRTWIDILPE